MFICWITVLSWHWPKTRAVVMDVNFNIRAPVWRKMACGSPRNYQLPFEFSARKLNSLHMIWGSNNRNPHTNYGAQIFGKSTKIPIANSVSRFHYRKWNDLRPPGRLWDSGICSPKKQLLPTLLQCLQSMRMHQTQRRRCLLYWRKYGSLWGVLYEKWSTCIDLTAVQPYGCPLRSEQPYVHWTFLSAKYISCSSSSGRQKIKEDLWYKRDIHIQSTE